MKRRTFLALASAAALPRVALGQRAKVPRIVYASAATPISRAAPRPPRIRCFATPANQRLQCRRRIVQAGANSQLGGRHDSLANRSYHSPGGNKTPIDAARKHAAAKPSKATVEMISLGDSVSSQV